MAFPTLVIPALLKSEEHIRFDKTLASWFGKRTDRVILVAWPGLPSALSNRWSVIAGSIMFICQPVGSVISGTVLEPLGRKYSMLLVNIPHLVGWYLFYAAISVPALFVAAVLMGLGKVIAFLIRSLVAAGRVHPRPRPRPRPSPNHIIRIYVGRYLLVI